MMQDRQQLILRASLTFESTEAEWSCLAAIEFAQVHKDVRQHG